MMLPWLGAAAIVIVAGILVGYLVMRKPRASSVQTADAPPKPPEDPPSGGGNGESTLERSKLVIHALLQSVSEEVRTLLGDASTYNDTLEKHKGDIKQAMTLAGIKELERVLLSELEQMQTTTAEYRKQLDVANSQLEAQQEQLEKLQADANIDFLTKVPNRRTFDERIKEELSRVKRYGGVFSLMVVDVDHFKNVNDLHGHLAGDRVLRAIAHILNEQRRASDFLARYGGEEFVALLPETTADRALKLAEKTRQKVQAARFRYETKSIQVTVSIGVGEVRPETDSLDDLFARVDAALYRAKREGRNRVQVAEGAEERQAEG